MTRHDEESYSLPSLRGEVDSFFNEVLGLRPRRGAPSGLWNPRLDLTEEADRYVLEMDLPGVRREDVAIEFEGHHLTISGSRELVRESAGPHFRQRERHYGTFRRTVVLGEAVDRDQISAALEQGILRVVLPKRGRVR